MIRYEDWTKLSDDIYVGSLRTAHDSRFLRERGIRGMLSLHPTYGPIRDVEQRNAFLFDGPGNDQRSLFDAVVALYELLNDEESKPVFVHCQAGVSRSPSVIAALNAARNGTAIEEELAAIANLRSIMPSTELVRDLTACMNDVRSRIAPSKTRKSSH